MIKKIILIFLGMFVLFINSSVAQEDIEKLYLRKAIKDFIAKRYDKAIGNLTQVLVANPNNIKAKKLMAKCHANKGSVFLSQNNVIAAEQAYNAALKYDQSNQMAASGLEQVQQTKANRPAIMQQPVQPQPAQKAQSASQKVPATQVTPTVQIPQTPQVIVNNPAQGGSDSNQVKIISSLVTNFNEQQKLFGEQMKASSKALERTEDTKEKYLDALVKSTEKNNSIMRNFLVIGGGIALGIILIVLIIFFKIFQKVTKASELRTVQANETLQLLLTSPAIANRGSGETPLMITGPQGASNTSQPADIENLNNEDPLQRANAVEAVAAEVIDVKENERLEKINKLEELLNDENNRVRANAAKAIYEIDKDMSLSTLKKMLDNPSKRMRASGVWALGEIGSEDALNLILSIQDEDDEIVKYNIKVALGKIKSIKRFPLSNELKERIETSLEEYKDMV